MPKSKHTIIDTILEGHKRGVKKAIDDSIRTGVPLVVSKRGKNVEIMPKFKYVLTPILTKKTRPNQKV